MLLDTSKPFEAKKALTRMKFLIDKGAKIELLEKKPRRSLRQNNFLHAIFTVFAIELGEHPEYVKQYIFKQVVNPETFKKDFVNKKTGEIREMWLSTSELKSDELSLAIERFRNFASTHGCYIMSSEEFIEQKFYFDQLVEQHKEFI